MVWLLVIIYIAFISLGLPDSILGSAWPVMHKDLSVSLAGAGIISMIIFGGTIVSSLFSGKLIKRFGTGKLTAVSVCMTALALFGFSMSRSYYLLCIMAIPLGLGAGAVDSALNNFVALHYTAKHMSWLHCFWGVGATLGPVIMSWWIGKNQAWNQGYLTIASLQGILVIILLVTLPMWKRYEILDEQAQDANASKENKSIWKIKGVTPALIAFFSYCAVELTTGLWGSSFLVNARNISVEEAAKWISMYYLGITAGRFVCGFLTKTFHNKSLIRVGQFLIGIGVSLLFIKNINTLNIFGLVIIGLGCSPIYPSMLHETPVRFGKENSQYLMGIQMAFAYMGSTFVPPIVGGAAEYFGIGIYPVLLMVLLLLMVICSETINRKVLRR